MFWFSPTQTLPGREGFKKVAPTGGDLEGAGRLYLFAAAGLCIAAISSCRPDIKENKGDLKYFDIKGYFYADSSMLTSKHPLITKTVSHNGITQTKKVYIGNWGNEFAPFINSDINKPAWRESYTVTTGTGVMIYNAKTPDLKTTKVIISKNGDKLNWIEIDNHTKNLLYEDYEKLVYYPDSLYSISKWQKVRFLGENIYLVKGAF